MSRNTAKKANELALQPELIFDAKRDINPFWRSSLFSDVYLKNDVPEEYKHLWGNDEIGGFHDFYQGFVDLCVETEHEAFDKWKEADTVKNWIVHVMDLLGWENNSERRSNSYMDNESFTVVDNGRKQTFRPDLIYFDKPKHKSYTQKEKDIDRKLSEARNKRTGTKIVVEAKYWDRLSHMAEQSKKDAKVNDSASALGPELQTLKYMEIFDHDFGVLTDGKTWRLFHKELSQGMDRRSFDFDLGNLRELALDLDSYQNEEKFRHYAKYFYYFFAKESLIQSEELKTAPFVHEVFEYSKKYAHSIEEDLKKRFIISMGLICNAIHRNNNESLELDVIRNVCESHLFNILFVKSCEVRRILPINSTQYLRKSLHEIVETLDAMDFDPEKDIDDYLRDFRATFGKKFDWDGYEIFNRIIGLYEIIHDGTAKSKDFGFEVDGFKESVFSKEEWKIAKNSKISNKDMVEVIFNLNFIESSFKGRKYQQIPYSYFTPRQLGSIYESFLEYQLEKAENDMIFNKGQWQEANLSSQKVKKLKLVDQQVAKKGCLFFSPNNKERKITGSYYTPDYIVELIIKESLEEKITSLTSEEILSVKVCDPAMGSGHFLSGALDYLVSEYRLKWSEENNDDIQESVEVTSRKILDSCLFGVDINPRAVKLAKMSLWLVTASAGKKLERLDDQLFTADSLEIHKKTKLFKNNFFAIIGNPPYGVEYTKEEREVLYDKFKTLDGKNDSFHMFLEKMGGEFDDMKEGALGFIVPNSVLLLDSFLKLREELVDKFDSLRVLDFKYQVFEDAHVDTCVLVFKKGRMKPELKYSFIRDKKSLDTEKNDFESTKFISDSWRSSNTDSVITRWKSTLGDYFDICQGTKAYEVGKGNPPQTREMLDTRHYTSLKKEKPSYRPFLYGSDIGQFKIIWKKGEYIQFGRNLAAPRAVKFHNQDRVVVQRIRNPKLEKRLIASFLGDDSIASAGLSIIVPKADVKVSMKALSVYLNLPSVNEWFKTINNDVNVKPTKIKTIPIEMSFISKGSFLEGCHNECEKLSLEEKDSTKLDKLLSKIDKEFCDLVIGDGEKKAA